MLPRRLVVALAAIARASDALSVDPFAWRDRDPFAPAGAAMAAASRLRSAAAVAPVGAPAPRPATSLRYYLDTADADEWAALLPLGIFRGVTTNPTLLERAGVTCSPSSAKHLAESTTAEEPGQKSARVFTGTVRSANGDRTDGDGRFPSAEAERLRQGLHANSSRFEFLESRTHDLIRP